MNKHTKLRIEKEFSKYADENGEVDFKSLQKIMKALGVEGW